MRGTCADFLPLFSSTVTHPNSCWAWRGLHPNTAILVGVGNPEPTWLNSGPVSRVATLKGSHLLRQSTEEAVKVITC